METIIVHDYETSGSRINFCQVIQAGIVICDNKLKIKSKHELRCRLKPNVIPAIGASLVHRASVDQLKNSNMSHYQMVLEHYKIIKDNTPSYITGFNNIAFDLEFYRRMLFKSLIPEVYQTNTNGNRHLDILNVARASKFSDENGLKTILSVKNRNSFKLVDLCTANLIDNGASHDAVTDCLNTIGIAEIIYKKTNDIWNDALITTSKKDTENFILKNKVYTSLEYFYGRSVPFACHHILFHPEFNWSINWDCKVDPSNYLEMDRQTLSKALDASPKICRTVKANKSPVLLKADYALNTENYKKIGIDEINKRVQILKDNPKFIELISSILSDKAKEKMSMDQTEVLFEETIYGGGFASEKDKLVMKKFHEVDWKEKVNLIEEFSEERFQYFAECLIYEESPESLPKSIYNKIHRSFAQRLLSTNKEKWETIPSFFSETDTLRETKYKDDKEMLAVIEGYNQHVMEIQTRFENA
jgi:exodeoxyribonuclease I